MRRFSKIIVIFIHKTPKWALMLSGLSIGCFTPLWISLPSIVIALLLLPVANIYFEKYYNPEDFK